MTDVQPIIRSEVRELLYKYHYLGGRGFRMEYAYGLFIKDILVGAIVFHGLSVPETAVGMLGLQRDEQSGIYEIGRLVLIPACNGSNAGSHLIAEGIRQLRQETTVKAILTYADDDLHHGAVYQASSFKYYGLTAPKKDFWILQSDGSYKKHNRGKMKGLEGEWRPRSRKHRYLRIYWRILKKKIRWVEQPYIKR